MLPLAALALPLQGLVGSLVRLRLGSPAIFSQQRPGRYGEPFRLYKFRTMRDEFDYRGEPVPDEDRLAAFGLALRSTSLDELPEFWNVIKGDMSLVGPRPLLTEYLARYSPQQARRHEARPGITGWAQVNGRNALDWPGKLPRDTWYVDHMSRRLDLKILWRSMKTVVSRSGVSREVHVTTPKFMVSATRHAQVRPRHRSNPKDNIHDRPSAEAYAMTEKPYACS